jgi:sugar phosphate isomerase/epimerase
MRLGFAPSTAFMLDTSAAFRLAADLGLEFVELSADLHEVMPRLQDPSLVRELQRATGVGATVHLSFVDLNIASVVPAARRTSVERTVRGLEFAHAVDAACAVLHSGLQYLRHPVVDPFVAAAVEASLGEVAGSDVPIALENLVLTDDDYVRGPEALRDLTRRHRLANCLDFGHAHVEGTRVGRDRLSEYQSVLGADVIHLHLHNNDGSGDHHRATPDGAIDYAAQCAYLAAFTGTACLEIAGGDAAVRASVTHLRRLLEGVGS